uniref:Uncharacterized protein n=1 Tax=Tetradesmus obliquus TaxID=3088 RepID=A0A383WQ60_TETOB|eukprot:jgi/Sobl393_1/8954/SZX79364.1
MENYWETIEELMGSFKLLRFFIPSSAQRQLQAVQQLAQDVQTSAAGITELHQKELQEASKQVEHYRQRSSRSLADRAALSPELVHQLTDQQQDSMSGTLSSVQQHQLQQQLFPILGHCRSGTELVHMAGCTDHFLQHTLPQCCEYPAVQASALQALFELQQAAASNRLLPGHYLDLCELLLRATTPHQLCDQLAGVRTRYAKLQDWYAAQAAAADAAAEAEAEAAAAAEAEAAAGPIQFSDDLLAELSAELGGAAAPDMAAAAAAVSPEACSKAAVSLALVSISAAAGRSGMSLGGSGSSMRRSLSLGEPLLLLGADCSAGSCSGADEPAGPGCAGVPAAAAPPAEQASADWLLAGRPAMSCRTRGSSSSSDSGSVDAPVTPVISAPASRAPSTRCSSDDAGDGSRQQQQQQQRQRIARKGGLLRRAAGAAAGCVLIKVLLRSRGC